MKWLFSKSTIQWVSEVLFFTDANERRYKTTWLVIKSLTLDDFELKYVHVESNDAEVRKFSYVSFASNNDLS